MLGPRLGNAARFQRYTLFVVIDGDFLKFVREPDCWILNFLRGVLYETSMYLEQH